LLVGQVCQDLDIGDGIGKREAISAPDLQRTKHVQLFAIGLGEAEFPLAHPDICDLKATAAAMQKQTKLLVVETISNPTLRVADIRALLDARRGQLKMDVIRDYYRLFGREAELDGLLAEPDEG